MLMTIGGLFVATILLAISLFTKKWWLTKFTLGGVAIWFIFYGLMLFGFSLLSTEKILAVNEPKAYCGFYFDCHLHAVVTKVETADRYLGRKADGKFYGVVVKVFSDAGNPDIRFHLIDPAMVIIDSQGNRFERNERVEDDLYSQPVWLGADIRGNETLEKELVFDIPASSTGLKMEITEGHPVDRLIEYFLIGDEDSIWHERSYFNIQEKNETASAEARTK